MFMRLSTLLCSCDRLSFRSDIHAPDSVRVNAALSQMQEFSNAFLSEAPGISSVRCWPLAHSHLLRLQVSRRVAHEQALEQVQGVVTSPQQSSSRVQLCCNTSRGDTSL
jgi:hypothetical protein